MNLLSKAYGKAPTGSRDQHRVVLADRTLIIITAALLLGALYQFQLDDWGWRRGAWINVGFAVFGMLLLSLRKVTHNARAALICMWLLAYILWDFRFGLVSGLNYVLLLTPAIMFLLFAPKYRWHIAVASGVTGFIFAWTDLFFPWQIGWNDRLWDHVTNPFTEDVEIEGYALLFIIQIVAMQAGLFVVANSAFSALERAELALQSELKRSDSLLHQLLPTRIAEQLRRAPDRTIAENAPHACILFADVAGFTAFSSDRAADETVRFLTALFTEFDALVDVHQLDKIKTIGDAYMVAGGLDPADPDPGLRIAALALEMIETMEHVAPEFDSNLKLRIGIHSGPVTAGVIGQHRPFFDVWGDTVNVASRMESTSEPGRAQVTHEMMQLLSDKFQLQPRDTQIVKGKGALSPYWLVSRK